MLDIVHISDIHIGRSRDTDEKAAVLAGHLARAFPSGTVVVITGDLVHSGTEAEYTRLRSSVLSPLRERFTVLSCPGNHDCCDWMGFRFSEESASLYREHVDGAPFPQAHVMNGEKTVLIGLDSSDPQDRTWLARGWMGGQQVARLAELLAEHAGKLRIVYFHHHPFMIRAAMLMVGSSALLKTLASGGAGAALFGHRHWSQEFRDTKGVPLMLASGSSTSPGLNGRLSFRVLEVADGAIRSVRTEEVS